MYRIIVELGNEVLFDKIVRNSFFQLGGEMRKDGEDNADTRAKQDGSFFASLTNRTCMYDIDLSDFAGFHGVRLTATDVLNPVALKSGTSVLGYPWPVAEVITAAYVPSIGVQSIVPDKELFFVGKASVTE